MEDWNYFFALQDIKEQGIVALTDEYNMSVFCDLLKRGNIDYAFDLLDSPDMVA